MLVAVERMISTWGTDGAERDYQAALRLGNGAPSKVLSLVADAYQPANPSEGEALLALAAHACRWQECLDGNLVNDRRIAGAVSAALSGLVVMLDRWHAPEGRALFVLATAEDSAARAELEQREAPARGRSPAPTLAGFFGRLAQLIGRAREAVRGRGDELDRGAALFVVVNMLVALEAMIAGWGEDEAGRIERAGRALQDGAAARAIVSAEASPATRYQAKPDEARLFGELRALSEASALVLSAEHVDELGAGERRAAWAVHCSLAGAVALLDRWNTSARLPLFAACLVMAEGVEVRSELSMLLAPRPIDPPPVRRVPDVLAAIGEARRVLDDLVMTARDATRPEAAQQFSGHHTMICARALDVLEQLRSAELGASEITEAGELGMVFLGSDAGQGMIYGAAAIDGGGRAIVVPWLADPAELSRRITRALRSPALADRGSR